MKKKTVKKVQKKSAPVKAAKKTEKADPKKVTPKSEKPKNVKPFEKNAEEFCMKGKPPYLPKLSGKPVDACRIKATDTRVVGSIISNLVTLAPSTREDTIKNLQMPF